MRIKPRAIATVLCMIFFVGFAVCGVVRSTDKETSEIRQSYPVLAEAEPVIMADLLMVSPDLEPEVKKEPDYPLTQEEIDLIALVTMGEAEGETELGKRSLTVSIIHLSRILCTMLFISPINSVLCGTAELTAVMSCLRLSSW